MRLFIAVNFNSGTRTKLLALRDELRENSTAGNFSLPENMHLTLVFLGECDKEQVSSAKNVINKLQAPAFEVVIDRIGRFKRDGGDVWWAGVRENKALSNLQRELAGKLAEAGFALENRRYSPHITLGRRVETEMRPREIGHFGETANSIELMKSERINGKLTYTAIGRSSHTR